ncbi:o-succinylbenzoate synthase [Raoultibacter phocaeensis]|uniref:o-succinylbenzoate synthase n=1 Tax=Raoultibacter phocaeensis TaxID=2479841 RepID=UPI0011182A23|nr:o-succinylbenzoate synthase [Raoultibacter phocaeensis]
MIQQFEQTMRKRPHDVFFQYVDDAGVRHAYSYEETKFFAAGLALLLRDRGIARGSGVAVDMPNCPEFVFMALAAGYGGFTLIALNHRLTEDEKTSRIADLRLLGGADVSVTLTERDVIAMLGEVPGGYDEAYRLEAAMGTTTGARAVAAYRHELDAGGARGHAETHHKQGFFARLRGKDDGASATRSRKSARQGEGALEGDIDSRSVVNFAERARVGFDRQARALVMFTSGTMGRPKAASLTWENLIGSAESSNTTLNRHGEGLWQAALPLFHIGGFQIVVRSVLNETPFILYRAFKAKRVLDDARAYGATHISVVDKMLQDLLAADDGETLSQYRCLLLGGAAPNPATLKRAVAAEARVYASFGMTETSSQIASSPVGAFKTTALTLLPGYEARVVNPDESGAGQLAVRGPGVFSGYLNARTPYTADGFFLTGDTASCEQGRLTVFERSGDLFVSGGENVYPAEIESKIMHVGQVSDAFVFGAEDPVWGRRPVAFVERTRAEGIGAADSPRMFAETVRESLARRVSKLYQPKHVFVLDEFPRTGVGKTDRVALRHAFDERIELKRVTLYRIEQNLATPFMTAKTVMRTRESVIVEVEDHAGRIGLGECVAFPTDWYLPETLGEDMRVLENDLIPLVLSQVYLHPSEVAAAFAECGSAKAYPLARGALEPALWDLYGNIVGKPLWQLIGGARAKRDTHASMVDPAVQTLATAEVRAGVVLGMMSVVETLAQVGRYVEAGYDRVKLKVKPGDDYARVRAVRVAYPQLTIMLDANQSYTEHDLAALKSLDTLGVRCIEEPLDPTRVPAHGPTDLFARLARLQRELSMRVCLDESVVTEDDLACALAQPELTCYAVKIGKLGGVQPSLDFYREATARGIELWMAGMYETGVSKQLHAAFETLLGVNIPGDISETARYFEQDITIPPFTVEQGSVVLNQKGYETGLGCELDYDALANVLVERRDYRC